MRFFVFCSFALHPLKLIANPLRCFWLFFVLSGLLLILNAFYLCKLVNVVRG